MEYFHWPARLSVCLCSLPLLHTCSSAETGKSPWFHRNDRKYQCFQHCCCTKSKTQQLLGRKLTLSQLKPGHQSWANVAKQGWISWWWWGPRALTDIALSQHWSCSILLLVHCRVVAGQKRITRAPDDWQLAMNSEAFYFQITSLVLPVPCCGRERQNTV